MLHQRAVSLRGGREPHIEAQNRQLLTKTWSLIQEASSLFYNGKKLQENKRWGLRRDLKGGWELGEGKQDKKL